MIIWGSRSSACNLRMDLRDRQSWRGASVCMRVHPAGLARIPRWVFCLRTGYLQLSRMQVVASSKLVLPYVHIYTLAFLLPGVACHYGSTSTRLSPGLHRLRNPPLRTNQLPALFPPVIHPEASSGLKIDVRVVNI